MPGPGGRDFQQSYNCQAVVDSECQVIVAARATNVPSDKQQAMAMVVEAIGNVGTVLKEVSVDARNYSATAGCRHQCPVAAYPGDCPEGPDAARVADEAGT